MALIFFKWDGGTALQLKACGWPKGLPILFWWLCLVLLGGAGNSQGAPVLTTNSPFVCYLKNPPWIKKIEFRRSQLLVGGRTIGHVDIKRWFIESYEAAIQPSGIYYIRRYHHLPINASTPVGAIRQDTGGISKQYFWSVYWGGESTMDDRNLTLAPRLVEEGASAGNEGQNLVNLYQAQIECVRFWGMPKLQSGSFSLTGENEFKAEAADGRTLNGKALDVNNDQPLSLIYRMSDGSEVSVRYAYADNQPLPNYYEAHTTRDGQPISMPLTNWIDEVVYGLESDVKDGYSPSAFFTNFNKFTHVTVWSNGIEYAIGPKGERIVIQRSMPPGVLPFGMASSRKSARWVMASIVFMSAIGCWMIVRRNKSA